MKGGPIDLNHIIYTSYYYEIGRLSKKLVTYFEYANRIGIRIYYFSKDMQECNKTF